MWQLREGRVSQVSNVDTKAQRMSLYQSAFTAGSFTQAEHGQYFLPGVPVCYRLSQHRVGPRPIAPEMGTVEPQKGGTTSYRPSSSAISGI
jgi:hypothetical protein